ncbi:L,D-transpeptidase family protein [Shewanella sp. CG12_big_fil_rev_8_21_14_0_65_47_15]|uniref:L,D-transpeptidase family protein n=1 Tax=Shewanella sp. CG12_big_fil_rev_8_21_14_0_65_47_15 TaxID=1975537 RepID=UPI000CC5061B|nr:L,D-transpeptidase family protein [Shewanella sp. CG12_big_fil_rev_8_21_14_0_65_47_15]PIW60424.1 MAG: murein L,D-transpeptidase [Shewanella sp. CG12_big_fil_rev_8_21_14_0_65_47_15]
MAKYHPLKLYLCLLCSLLASPSLASSLQLEALLEPIAIGERAQIDNTQIISAKLVSRIYQVRQYEPLWNDRDYAGTLLNVLKNADDEGLAKEDYHYPRLMELYSQLTATNWHDEQQSKVFEILLTDGIITYAIHLLNGKINPSMLGKTWNYDETQLDFDTTLKQLETHIQSHTIADAIAGLAPNIAPYHELKRYLAHYRDLAKRYPFEAIPYTEVIKPGASHPSLAAIGKRLSELGYSDETTTDNAVITTYDNALENRIRRFQTDHSLTADGIIGAGTMAALNVPYARRVEQIRINLERARWLSADLTENYLIINLAGYELLLFKDNALSWRTDIIIGKVNTKTPLFKSKLKYLVVNPTWTVPRSIFPEIIGHVRKDPDYLKKKHFNVVEGSGTPVNVDHIDWQTTSPKNFPYWFVQQPGNDNSLGQVKFIFPNQYAIYLHDTPSKKLFERTDRAFSHGCIRVKDPLVLADKLLSANGNWTPASLSEKLAEGKTENIFLDEPLDILIMYWTVSTREGKLRFYNDIYQRDPVLIEALNRPTYDAVLAKDGLLNIIE